MIIGVLSSAAMMASAPVVVNNYDPQKHLDATFYHCNTYTQKDLNISGISENESEFRSHRLGILVWFEFDETSGKQGHDDIPWKHAVTAPSIIFNNGDSSSIFTNIRDVSWEISALSDGHVGGSTHWDRIIYYYKPTDQPNALISVVQEERASSDNGIADVTLERVYHANCNLHDDENAFKLYNEFAS